jgi:hypothetical protein
MDTPDPGGKLKSPRRAEPLQPDAPAKGDRAETPEDPAANSERSSGQRSRRVQIDFREPRFVRPARGIRRIGALKAAP